MKEYIVIKDILNVRDKPVMDDSSFVSELYRGDIVYLHEQLIPGDMPAGATTNLWMRDHFERVVHNEGVRELSWPEKKEQIVKAIKSVAGTSGITVAVVDTGVDDNITYLKNAVTHFVATNGVLVAGGSAIANFHGSTMGVIIAGKNSQPDPVIGIMPEARVVDYRVFPQLLSVGLAANILATLTAIEQINEIKVINLSLELQPVISQISPGQMQQIDNSVKKLIANGKIVIAATGNSICAAATRDIQFPGVLKDVITVSILANGVPVVFNNCIGGLQLSRQPDCFLELDDWDVCDTRTSLRRSTTLRSSEATAFFSGLVAVKKSQNPGLTQQGVRELINKCISNTETLGSLSIRKLDIAAFLRQSQ